MMADQPLLLDCTRIVARRWANRQPSGIDRVCDAYLAHFAPRAQAVVQYRGKARILSGRHSQRLFALLTGQEAGFRQRFARFAPRAFAASSSRPQISGATYLNVSHTDFDLPAHRRWVREGALRAVYLLHDLIPIQHPQWTTSRRVARHRGRVVQALAEASGIIVNSSCTARQLTDFARQEGLTPPPVLSAPLAAGDLPAPAAKPATLEAPYFVCVATIEARKNHLLLLKAWRKLIAEQGDAAPRLVLIGQWGIRSERVRQMYRGDPHLPRFVTILERCSDHELACWLAGAKALLAPSRAEGFGLPLAEALKLGVPVIASDLPAFAEFGAGIPKLLDPTDDKSWLAAIRDFATDGSERLLQLAKLRQYRAPQWADHFALVEPWLSEMASAGLPTSQPQAMMNQPGVAIKPQAMPETRAA